MDFILSLSQTILAFILILSILVFIHEYGHYLGCKICGVKVDSFSIGMGKEVWGWTDKSGVRWKVSMLPLGGYLKMYGDENAASGKADKNIIDNLTEEEKEVSFYYQNPYKKFLIVFFGPLFNLIFAALLLTLIIKVNGVSVSKPIVDLVVENSPAQIAGLQQGDEIITANGKKIKVFNDLMTIVAVNNLAPLKMEVLRNNELVSITIEPKLTKSKDVFGNEIEIAAIGVGSSASDMQEVGIFRAFWEGNKSVLKMCKSTLIVLGQIITGNRGTEGLGGPIKIAQYSAQSFSGGFLMVIYFMAMISANLGLMNLLPIPVLDGGHLIFFIIEMLFKRPVPEKIQEKLLQGGFAILIALMVFATFNDIRGFF